MQTMKKSLKLQLSLLFLYSIKLILLTFIYSIVPLNDMYSIILLKYKLK